MSLFSAKLAKEYAKADIKFVLKEIVWLLVPTLNVEIYDRRKQEYSPSELGL